MSSESDDDCYGNVAQTLQRLKNKYQGDKNESSSFLDDSTDLDNILQKHNSGAKTETATASASFEDIAGPSVSTELDSSQEIQVKTRPKRRTRASAKTSNSEPEALLELPPTRRSRRKRGRTTPEASPRVSGRGRGRGRGRIAIPSPRSRNRGGSRGRGRRNTPTIDDLLSVLAGNFIMPTYSIGDAEDVDDQSRGQALFSNKNTDEVVVVEENDPLDENEELSVKVYWQSCEFFRFTIRKFQKLTQIFDHFSEKYKISYDNLLFTYNDKIIKPDNTPESINYNIGKFIEGGIVNRSISQLVIKDNERIKDGVKVKFQCQNMKKPFELTIRLADKFSLAMTKCAEHLEMPLNKLKFEFDGDSISGKSTARDLELEGGECIDVKIIS